MRVSVCVYGCIYSNGADMPGYAPFITDTGFETFALRQK